MCVRACVHACVRTELKTLYQTKKYHPLISSFPAPLMDFLREEHCLLYTGSPTPVPLLLFTNHILIRAHLLSEMLPLCLALDSSILEENFYAWSWRSRPCHALIDFNYVSSALDILLSHPALFSERQKAPFQTCIRVTIITINVVKRTERFYIHVVTTNLGCKLQLPGHHDSG